VKHGLEEPQRRVIVRVLKIHVAEAIVCVVQSPYSGLAKMVEQRRLADSPLSDYRRALHSHEPRDDLRDLGFAPEEIVRVGDYPTVAERIRRLTHWCPPLNNTKLGLPGLLLEYATVEPGHKGKLAEMATSPVYPGVGHYGLVSYHREPIRRLSRNQPEGKLFAMCAPIADQSEFVFSSPPEQAPEQKNVDQISYHPRKEANSSIPGKARAQRRTEPPR
jgi:hypothetical protein